MFLVLFVQDCSPRKRHEVVSIISCFTCSREYFGLISIWVVSLRGRTIFLILFIFYVLPPPPLIIPCSLLPLTRRRLRPSVENPFLGPQHLHYLVLHGLFFSPLPSFLRPIFCALILIVNSFLPFSLQYLVIMLCDLLCPPHLIVLTIGHS